MLKAGEILVWRARLDELPERDLPPLLPEESARAGRFRSDEVRTRFVRSHGVLRAILASLNLPPDFARDDRNKPFLPGLPDVHFNLSRSRGMALYAVARGVEVGVDVERVRSLPEYLAIAERFLPPSHYAALLEAPQEARLAGFFRVWTRLEASLKAIGVGLYGAGEELAGPWTLAEIDAGEGFAAAVAAPAENCRVIVRDFA